MATNTPPNTATPPGANTQTGNPTPRLTPKEFLVEWQLQAQQQQQTDPAIVEAHEGYVKYHTGQAQAQQQANAPRFTPIEAVEALAPRPPKDYLLDSIYIAGKLYIVAGDAGTGKSFYSLGLAMHIANGEPFLGHPTKQCPVLYIDEENGKDEYLERVKWIAKGAGFDLDTTPLIGFTDDGLNIANQDDLDELEQFILDRGIRFAVIDSLVATIGGLDENSASDMEPPLRELGQLARRTNCTILAIHHVTKPTNGKPASYRGSSTIKGKVDGLQIFDNVGEDCSRVRFEKNRQGKRFDYSFETEFLVDDYTGDTVEVRFTPKALASYLQAPPKHTMDILEYLDSNGGGETLRVDIVNALILAGTKSGTVDSALSRTLKDGFITKTQDRPATYALTKEGIEAVKKFGGKNAI